MKGEIEMISQMKAKGEKENEVGFLEYFEDIIGTDAYKERLGELSIEYDCSWHQQRASGFRVKFSSVQLTPGRALQD